MRNDILMNAMIFGIISLFIGTSIVPSIVGEKMLQDESLLYNKLLPNNTLFSDKLDQENLKWGGALGSSEPLAQSFKPTLNMLTRVELIVFNDGNPQGYFTISIRENLNGTDLTSETIPVENLPKYPPIPGIWVEFDFPDVEVVPQKTYYIVVSYDSQGTSNMTLWCCSQPPDSYRRGEPWAEGHGYWYSRGPCFDFCFKTYGYTTIIPNQPPSVVYVDDNFDTLTRGWGYDHFNVIQDGINAVTEHGTVYVYSGTYYEHVFIDKTINLIGENKASTIIDGGSIGDDVYVSADWVNISGFSITNSGENYWTNAGIDICSDFNTITDNNVNSNNYYGIYLQYSSNNIITGDNANSNINCGIYLSSSSNNTVTNNYVSNNNYGISLFQSSSNNIFYNNFFSNTNNYYDDNTGNNIWNISKTPGTNIIGGPYLGGNYWSDYTGFDTNHDGLGDTSVPYGPGDYLPLVSPNQQPDIVYVDDRYTSSTPGWQYDHFNHIQDGINAVAQPGTVYVYSGTYYENVVIKDSISLVGEDKNTTIIDGQKTPNKPVILTKSNIQISGFTISNGTDEWHFYPGIYFYGSFVKVQDCNIKDCNTGIYCGDGFQNNSIVNCSIFDNWNVGIWLTSTSGTLVRNYFISKCKFFNNGEGITTNYMLNSLIDNCSFMNNAREILDIQGSSYNKITNCNISNNNAYCIIIHGGSSYNVITGNIFSNNEYGIVIGDSSTVNNVIYHNNFINNNASDDSNNSWDNGYPSGGNYWSDYTGYDIYHGPNQDIPGSDGIGDTPYLIQGGNNQDRYPLGVFHNIPPVANFIYIPSSPTDLDVIHFTDTSIDTDGTITSWSWNFGDGNTSTLQNPTHKYADEGTYHVTLTVTDDDGASNSISKDVIVSNVAPVADANGPYNGTTDYAIQFNGLGCYDSDGVIVSYAWNFGDGNTGSGVHPTHRYSKYGVYNVTLTVTDDDGLTDTDGTLAIINKGTPPIIHILYPTNGEVVKGTITVKWYAHDAHDGDNLPIYIYFREDNNTLWSAFKGNPYSNDGSCDWDTTTLSDRAYQLLIEAVDSEGNIGADMSTFQIKNQQPPVNHEPLKPNTPSGPTNGKKGQNYSYTTSTTDPDGNQVYYLWDWGDGNNSGWLGPYNSGVTINTTHMWTVKGSYSIKVKAKDIYGKESIWSDLLPITMPYSFDKPILKFLELLFQRFPNVFPLLRHLLQCESMKL